MPFTTTRPVGLFTDINGKPLDGQVWFGQPNLDPIANPITVYWDAAGTQPVTQPVVTVGGYPMNGSTRSNVFVNADYSILVRNRNGFTVFSAPNLPFEDSSDNQYFFQAGSGSVQRTVQSKLRDVVSVKDFGAVGDGVADDTAAIQAANTYCTTNQATLYFPRSTSFYKITSDITLTCDIEAGWYQIFNSAGTYIVKGLREIYFEWFGAKGDALSPTIPVLGKDLATFNPVTNVPTGTDDSVAIRTAMKCAINTNMMSNHLDPAVWGSPNTGPGSQPFWGGTKLTAYPCVIKGRPNAGYLVSGDNLLGPQSTINGKLYFDGQGCSFEWLPSATNDSFIDKLDLIERPVLKNFTLKTWGFTGNRGRFIHTQNSKQFINLLRGAELNNINIDRGGYYNLTTDPLNVTVPGPATGNALSKVFHLEGTNLCDTWNINHCQFWGYANFLTLSNPEAVSISIHDSDLASYYPNAVHVDVTTGYSGGLWFTNCQLGMLGSGQTWFRTRSSSASIGDFYIAKSRMETRYDNYTLIDAEYGAFFIEDLQPNYGNPTSSASAYSAKVSKWTKTVQFKNCWMPQKVQLWAYTDANFTTYSGNFEPLVYDTVTFPNGSPTVEWIRSDTLASVDIPALFSAKLRFRNIRFINSPQNWNFANSLLFVEPSYQRMIAFFDPADGKTYIDNSGIALPIGIVITSIKVVCDASGGYGAVDRINLAFNGGPSFQAVMSATDVTTTELIPTTKKGMAISSTAAGFNIVTADYYNGPTTPAAPGNRVPCTITFTYRSMLGATDLNTASIVPVLV